MFLSFTICYFHPYIKDNTKEKHYIYQKTELWYFRVKSNTFLKRNTFEFSNHPTTVNKAVGIRAGATVHKTTMSIRVFLLVTNQNKQSDESLELQTVLRRTHKALLKSLNDSMSYILYLYNLFLFKVTEGLFYYICIDLFFSKITQCLLNVYLYDLFQIRKYLKLCIKRFQVCNTITVFKRYSNIKSGCFNIYRLSFLEFS